MTGQERSGMRILLTNDDGIHAPGLRALWKELIKLGDVQVVAPATEQSAAGHSITLSIPLIVQEVRDEESDFQGWAVEGRPADCVKLALLELLKEPPDLVVSGLNAGSNSGINVLYSGTVAAAVEGAFFRITSIACSQEFARPETPSFQHGAEVCRQIIEQVLEQNPQKGSLFNVNVPSPEIGPLKGIKALPMNVAPYIEQYVKREDPRGRTYFWSGADHGCPEPHPDTDVTALEEGYATITPLFFDLTHSLMLQQMQQWQWQAPNHS